MFHPIYPPPAILYTPTIFVPVTPEVYFQQHLLLEQMMYNQLMLNSIYNNNIRFSPKNIRRNVNVKL